MMFQMRLKKRILSLRALKETLALTFLEVNPDPLLTQTRALGPALGCGSAFSSFTAKSASVRALLFDISFLMLCHVAQTYGSEVSERRAGRIRGTEWVGQEGRKQPISLPPVTPHLPPHLSGSWCRNQASTCI